MKKGANVYLIVFLLVSWIPVLGWLVPGQTDRLKEARDALPALVEEEGLNVHYLSDLGSFFQEHFAFRDEFLTGEAALLRGVFGVSAVDSVIAGTDGWLYYRDSLADYQRTEPLSDRTLFNIAHTMRMMEESLAARGIRFLYVIAPNKNSLYPEHMPYYARDALEKESNYTRLMGFLHKEQVTHTDLARTFAAKASGTLLYHREDSHWNNLGAALATDTVLQTLDVMQTPYFTRDYTLRKDFTGDLFGMLFPALDGEEEEYYLQKEPQFTYLAEVENNFAPDIYTVSDETLYGSLLMFRDSFGNALLPYLAESFGTAHFLRGIPYQLDEADTTYADTVVVEQAERFIGSMADRPPVMDAPPVIPEARMQKLPAEQIVESAEEILGERRVIRGSFAEGCVKDCTRVLVQTEEMLYEAFPVTWEDGKEGFMLYLQADESSAPGSFAVYLLDEPETNM